MIYFFHLDLVKQVLDDHVVQDLVNNPDTMFGKRLVIDSRHRVSITPHGFTQSMVPDSFVCDRDQADTVALASDHASLPWLLLTLSAE